MSSLFNSPFEMSLRILLMLSENPTIQFDEDYLLCLDFITCYAEVFDIEDSNLHGGSRFKFAEFSNRRLLVREAIKQLVVKGLIEVTVDRKYLYSICESGIKFADSLNSEYAATYRNTYKSVFSKYMVKDSTELIHLIRTRSLQGLRG